MEISVRKDYREIAEELVIALACLPLEEQVLALNEIRAQLHDCSPFRDQPVDCVMWVPLDEVYANDYNPNSVAPPEMELLRVSIDADGYTQPIVSMRDPEGRYQVVDGFHRNRVGRECEDIRERVKGHLPVVRIREGQQKKANRMASTIRHNRARGKHRIEAMSEIVVELKRRNWSDAKVAKELGMDADEVLRLTQMAGIAELFADEDFSEAWDVIGDYDDADFDGLDDEA